MLAMPLIGRDVLDGLQDPVSLAQQLLTFMRMFLLQPPMLRHTSVMVLHRLGCLLVRGHHLCLELGEVLHFLAGVRTLGRELARLKLHAPPLIRSGFDLPLELLHLLAARLRHLFSCARSCLEGVALLGCEGQLFLRLLREVLHPLLQPLLLRPQSLGLLAQLGPPALVPLGVGAQVLLPLAQNLQTAADLHVLGAHLLQLGAGGGHGALYLRRPQVGPRALLLRLIDLRCVLRHSSGQCPALVLHLRGEAAALCGLPVYTVEPEEVVLDLALSSPGLQLSVHFCLLLLLCHALALVVRSSFPAVEEPCGIFLLRLLRGEALVLHAQLCGARDLLEERREVPALPARSGLHVALQHQEVARLGQDVDALQALHVLGLSHGLPVDKASCLAAGLDGAPEDDLAAATGRHEGQLHCRGPLHLLRPLMLLTVHELLHAPAAQVPRPDAEHEADGIHKVGLAGTIRPHNASELLEWPYHDAAIVGLEVLQDNLVHASAIHAAQVRGLGGGSRPSGFCPMDYET
mmetsp:Transcript_66702/g.171782  ORF Transcript_66702/g.171782 Transcript_66702/m.171782 type:complete len:519 (-) Transcript_66702:7-1563(-)